MNYLKKLPYKIKFVFIYFTITFYLHINMFYQLCKCYFYRFTEKRFRLHVIANSDSEDDQNLKLKVRDNVLRYMNTLCSKTTSKEEAIEIATIHLNEFKEIALNTIKKMDIIIMLIFLLTMCFSLQKHMVIFLCQKVITMH